MPASNSGREAAPPRAPAQFATTRWSVVLRAHGEDSRAAADALGHLCRTYWYPLYAHARRRGCGAHDAQDLTQDFFARLIAGDLIDRADPARGRFRSYVLTAFDHFLLDQREKSRALKRGGGHVPVSIDARLADAQFQVEPGDNSAPDKAFDRQWALALLGVVLRQLEDEHRAPGKAALFAALKPSLIGRPDARSYAQLAKELGTTEGALKVTVHRLRHRYRELLEQEISHTVASPDDVRAELRHLFQAVSEL